MSDPALSAIFEAIRKRLPSVGAGEAPELFSGNDSLRLHGGRWWREIEFDPDHAEVPYCVLQRGGLRERHQRWQAILNHADGAHRVRPCGPLSNVGGKPGLTLGTPDEDIEAFEASLPSLRRVAMDSAMLIDGRLHCACEGPVLIVQGDGRGEAHIWLDTASDADMRGFTALFAPSRWAEAVALGRTLTAREFPRPRGYEHLSPQAPDRDDAALVPMEVVHDTLAGCSTDGVALIAPDALDAMAGLRDLVARGTCTADEARRGVEALLAAVFEPEDASFLPKGELRAAATAARERVHAAARFGCDRIAMDSPPPDEDLQALSGIASG
jgi:hypothetical protein